MINFERNKQLNQFSNIYFNKIKINNYINEIKPIIIVPGELNTIFYEILFKSLRKRNLRAQ